ncbi:MAG: hypothetical protein J6T26_07665 [Firmicutes bacterium]|nr:hypothetical protein [Bacillota bacterium]
MDNLDNRIEENTAAEQPTDANGAVSGQQEGRDTGANGAPEVQEDAEQRSRNAEKRIRREQRIAEAARNAERTRTNDLLKRLGIERPDGSTIDSVDALEEYERGQSEERIKNGRANGDDLKRIVKEAMREQAPVPTGNEAQRQLDAIRDMDPEMTDLGAILQSDIGESFRKYVQGGASFTQAYGRAVREKNARTAGARASEEAKAAGKGHMAASSQRGAGALEVPPDEMRIIRALNPDATDAEIQKYYNADRKRFGR